MSWAGACACAGGGATFPNADACCAGLGLPKAEAAIQGAGAAGFPNAEAAIQGATGAAPNCAAIQGTALDEDDAPPPPATAAAAGAFAFRLWCGRPAFL